MDFGIQRSIWNGKNSSIDVIFLVNSNIIMRQCCMIFEVIIWYSHDIFKNGICLQHVEMLQFHKYGVRHEYLFKCFFKFYWMQIQQLRLWLYMQQKEVGNPAYLVKKSCVLIIEIVHTTITLKKRIHLVNLMRFVFLYNMCHLSDGIVTLEHLELTLIL